nr:ZmpA/ZmpB/ZmpC family metallo-endopeptidase-related protein [Salinisphaera sp. G21_0]
MVALDRLSGAAAVPSAGTPGSPDNPIPVGDSETLGKIGQDGFPPDAYYRQTKTFSHNSSVSVGNDDHPFTGHYNGDCYTISDSRRCLFHKLGRYSEVRDLRVANANINNTDKFSAALACEMEGKSTIRDVRIEDSRIINNRESERFDLACTGVITGLQQKDSVVERAEVKNSSVSTSGDYSAAGIGAGITEGKMHRLNVEEALVTTSGSHSDAGIGAGAMEGQIEQLTVSDSQVETRGSHAHAGIGGGEVDGVIQHLTVSGTNVTTDQYGADAGIGGGMVTGNINNITVVKSEVTTNGSLAYAGIGGGQVGHFRPGPFGGGTLRKGSINDLVALESHVRTEGNFASAGIGGGYVHDRVKGTTAVNCTVSARGRGGNDGAAIGAGFNTGKVINTRAVECTVTTDTGDNAGIAHGGFGRGAVIEDVRSLNSRVNSKLVNVGNLTMPGLCRTADPRLVTSDCQEHPGPVMDNPWNCSTTPLIAKRGSVWNPIPINDSKTFNKIGLDADYPPDAHYIQTGDLEGSELNNDKTVVFSGHYDGQKRIIDQQTMCLFPDLRGSVNNLQVVNARVSAENEAAAVVACTMDGTSRIGNIKVVNASVTIHGDSPAEGGIITAQQLSRESRIENIEVHNCTVETRGRDQLAGMVAGEIRGQVDDVTVQNSRISTQGYKAHGGIGGGLINGKLSHLTSVCNNVEVSGSDAFAGIGGGQIDPRGEVRDLTAINSTVRTMSDGANAGVGAGYISHAGKANTITALNCRVFTMGNGANAGVGAGKVGRYGELNAITAVNSEVIAVGGNSSAGVAAGVAAGGFADKSDARLTDISNVNTRVNFQTYSDTNISADTLCASADQHFVSSDCQLSSSLPDGTCPITTPMTTFTGMPLTLPTSSTMAAAAPAIATGLSTGAIAGIAVGVTAVVAVAGLGGVCLYRYYHREKESEPQQLLQLGDI